MLIIKNGFPKMADAKLIERCQQIIAAMTAASGTFPTPSPGIPTVQLKLTEFQTAVNSPNAGSRLNTAIKKEKKAELIDLLHNLGTYVLFTAASAANPELVAISSGFRIGKTPTPSPELVKPESITIGDGLNSGQLAVGTPRMEAAKGYIWQYTADPLTPASVWHTVAGSKRNNVISGLTVGQRIWCRVMVVGVKDQAVYSDAASRIVQ